MLSVILISMLMRNLWEKQLADNDRRTWRPFRKGERATAATNNPWVSFVYTTSCQYQAWQCYINCCPWQDMSCPILHRDLRWWSSTVEYQTWSRCAGVRDLVSRAIRATAIYLRQGAWGCLDRNLYFKRRCFQRNSTDGTTSRTNEASFGVFTQLLWKSWGHG